MKVLDTTFLIDVLRGRKETIPILKSNQPLLTTPINSYEVLTGLFLKNASAHHILEVRQLFDTMRMLPLDDRAVIKSAEINADLLKKGEAIEDCDCLTAGIALSNGISTIVTRNEKHFRRIKGLTVERY
ncbi:type II toxin-antitoxin system VapC family toxin [Candidatus Woesearchaeota archaeon]|nr:type II toxin-antitoxin system VapC family toxin [Candidatus Woesearchaeota archaeon]